MKKTILLLLSLLLIFVGNASLQPGTRLNNNVTEVKTTKFQIANILQSNMVIQQGKPFAIWGRALPGDSICVIADWQDDVVNITADEQGEWTGILKVPNVYAGNFSPHVIKVFNGADTIIFSNVLIGEVWICAGQSNMDMPLKKISGWYEGVLNYETEIEKATFPAIRVYTTSVSFKNKPQNDGRGRWEICSPETAGNFSAVSYFFGRELFRQLNVPVGLVVVAAAGASGQSFTPDVVLMSDSILNKLYWEPYKTEIISQDKIDSLDFFTKVTRPSLIYNGMIHPIENLSVRGFIWYQGESNYTDRYNYTGLCTAMINSWRQRFNQGMLPFYFVQIAPFTDNWDTCKNILSSFWEAQLLLLKMNNVGMALSQDVGEAKNIHPRDKRPVGVRLAKLALHRTYNFKKVTDVGPLVSGIRMKNNGKVKVSYSRASIGSGLTTKGGEAPKYFLLAGKDRVFYPANSKIIGRKVILWSHTVAHPVAVRYGFTNDAITNFQNKEGLPAFPYRSDRWPLCGMPPIR